MHRQMNKRRIVLLTPLLLGASMATAHGPSVFAQFQPPTAADRALLKDAVACNNASGAEKPSRFICRQTFRTP